MIALFLVCAVWRRPSDVGYRFALPNAPAPAAVQPALSIWPDVRPVDRASSRPCWFPLGSREGGHPGIDSRACVFLAGTNSSYLPSPGRGDYSSSVVNCCSGCGSVKPALLRGRDTVVSVSATFGYAISVRNHPPAEPARLRVVGHATGGRR